MTTKPKDPPKFALGKNPNRPNGAKSKEKGLNKIGKPPGLKKGREMGDNP